MRMSRFGLKNLLNWKESILHLIYPNSCIVCHEELADNNNYICPFCYKDLQFTFFERYEESTILDQLFWGRVQLIATYSMLFFEKEKNVKPILHALKYKDKPEIGIQFGKLIGKKIKPIKAFENLDALIPVPLHQKKQFIRGYNQSEKLAEGISSILNIPVDNDFLKRNVNTETQTKKNRFLRWENVQNKFSLEKNKNNYKHIAIIDDVITTGATLEAIIQAIQKNYPEVCISVISLAIAK